MTLLVENVLRNPYIWGMVRRCADHTVPKIQSRTAQKELAGRLSTALGACSHGLAHLLLGSSASGPFGCKLITQCLKKVSESEKALVAIGGRSWGLMGAVPGVQALTYFCIYVVRQGVTSWFVFYLMKVGRPGTRGARRTPGTAGATAGAA